MRRVVVTLLPLLLGAGGVLAQSGALPSGPAPAPPGAPAPARPPGQSPPTDSMAECMRLWDSATHMTKQEWSRTCRRIQTRLDNLEIGNLETTPKASRKSSRKKDAGG
jgi:hypothetical protein